MTTEAFCPHCRLPLGDDLTLPFPPKAIRCRHCQLIVGPDRARPEPHDDDSGPTGRGSAAGVYASVARRSKDTPQRPAAELLEAIVVVAGRLGSPVQRLLMLEYQRHCERDPELPALGEILAEFGSWKGARRLAVEGDPRPTGDRAKGAVG